jgi:hypothetical protein
MSRYRFAEDGIFRIHRWYLGPKGKTLPIPVPYAGFLPGAIAAFLVLVILSAFGVGLWRFVIAAVFAVGAGWLADRCSGSERPVSSLPVFFSHETSAPRPAPGETIHVVLRPGRIPVRSPGTAPRKGRRR